MLPSAAHVPQARDQPMPRRLLILVLVIVASQALPLSRLLPVLPGPDGSRSPSSDVLMGLLPFPDAALRTADLARGLPPTPGVIVAHTTPDRAASAYFVLSMHLWPRPVSLVACQPTPSPEQFTAAAGVPRDRWRIDVRPGDVNPVQLTGSTLERDSAALCAASGTSREAAPTGAP
jgi:hypothetical protein